MYCICMSWFTLYKQTNSCIVTAHVGGNTKENIAQMEQWQKNVVAVLMDNRAQKATRRDSSSEEQVNQNDPNHPQ